MNQSILHHIRHFQLQGELRTARRPLNGERCLEIARRQQDAQQAQREPQPGWLHLHGHAWERFRTHQRCLLLEYGYLERGRGRLLTVRVAPDGTALLRVLSVAPEGNFQQRLFCPAPAPPARGLGLNPSRRRVRC